MWSKIKQISISAKLTLLYTAMLFFILLFTNILTVVSLYHVLYTQANTDIASSTNKLQRYFSSNTTIDHHLLSENLLMPGVILKVFDAQNNIIVDSTPSLLITSETLGSTKLSQDLFEIILRKSTDLRLVHMDSTYYYYVTYAVQHGETTYQLHLLKALTEQTHFLQTLTKILGATNLIGLATALLSGIFISRRILHPLRSITATAREIEVDDLEKRIPRSGSGDELDELSATFNHMLARLQTGFDQQRRFVDDASHELMTPITVISGYVNMLLRWGKQKPQALEEGLNAIQSETANMTNLIEKLLYLAKADQGKQHLQKNALSLAPFLETIFKETRMIAPHHQITLAANEPAIVEADCAALKQMLRIFIENSIKYTPPGGSICLASKQMDHHLLSLIHI